MSRHSLAAQTAPHSSHALPLDNARTDAVMETLVMWSNVDSNTAWTPFTLTATGNDAGQTIRVYVQSQTNATLNTNFFMDSFALNVTACP